MALPFQRKPDAGGEPCRRGRIAIARLATLIVPHASFRLAASLLVVGMRKVVDPPGRTLWVAGRCVLPLLLTPVRQEVAHGVGEDQPVHPTFRRGVGAVDATGVPQEHAEQKVAACPT